MCTTNKLLIMKNFYVIPFMFCKICLYFVILYEDHNYKDQRI